MQIVKIKRIKQIIKETLLLTYSQGTFISEREFATNATYDYSAKATKFTQIVYISFEDFFSVVKENIVEMHKFCMFRDNLIFNENFRNFG
jgi:CRP-like cAMP-binding protein